MTDVHCSIYNFIVMFHSVPHLLSFTSIADAVRRINVIITSQDHA